MFLDQTIISMCYNGNVYILKWLAIKKTIILLSV